MCGIFGYIGTEDPLEMCLLGLEQLEYRGYDSTGIAGIFQGELLFCRETGKLSRLKEKLTLQALEVAIGHTRWATHGKVTEPNAHPQVDQKKSLAIVHNGIIENCDLLRKNLQEEGVCFSSETDTEILTHLIAKYYSGSLVEAVQKSLPFLKGHFAIAVIHQNHPEEIVAAARECPLSIGLSEDQKESIISSDPNGFLGKKMDVFFLKDDEVAKVRRGKVEIFNKTFELIFKKAEKLDTHYVTPSKGLFEHFLIKEIMEQPSTIQKAFLGRIEDTSIQFESLSQEFLKSSFIYFVSCGTSSYAGSIGSLFLEDFCQIPSHSEIASEARYRLLPKDALVVAISQSGETADTLSSVRELKARGHRVLAICNVKNSTLMREADASILLKAGPEISVCSTKAFSSQIVVLYLLALYLSGRKEVQELQTIPSQIESVLKNAPYIEQIAKKYSSYKNFFFMGRRYMYYTCMEAALKLKELSYLNANGYAAGELKHGAIALVDSDFPVIAFCANKQTEDKILSNLQEVKARGAPILAVAPEHLQGIVHLADDVIWTPFASDPLSPLASTVVGQLFAYYVAKERGCDIDHPRNLAKSVTVE